MSCRYTNKVITVYFYHVNFDRVVVISKLKDIDLEEYILITFYLKDDTYFCTLGKLIQRKRGVWRVSGKIRGKILTAVLLHTLSFVV